MSIIQILIFAAVGLFLIGLILAALIAALSGSSDHKTLEPFWDHPPTADNYIVQSSNGFYHYQPIPGHPASLEMRREISNRILELNQIESDRIKRDIKQEKAD